MGNKRPQTPPPPAAAIDHDDQANDPDLVSIIQQFPEARRVSIRRMNEDSDRWAHVGALSIDTFNEDTVQRKFGGGLYQFQFHGSDGRVLRKLTNIEIADPPEDERPPKTPPPPAAVPAAPSELTLLREQMSQDRLLMLELIRGISKQQPQQAPANDITQLVSALATLRSMEPKREQQPAAVQDLLLQSFTKGIEVAAKLTRPAGEANPLGEILGFVREVFQDARPIIQAAIANAAPIAAPAPPPIAAAPAAESSDEEMDETEIDLKPALVFVRQKLEEGTAPKALANIVLAQMQIDPSLNETLSALIADEPIESFLELAPELKAEPLRTKFGEFFGVVRARIFADRDSRGNSGNTTHPNGHAGIDAQSR